MDVEKYLSLIQNERLDKFEAYKNFLLEYNEKCNLTAVCDEKGVLYKHFLDSVAGESFFPFGAKAVEIGSGAGFPSLPLKIIRGDINFTLIESTGKKCAFLNETVEKLRLDGVKVVNARAEEAAKDKNLREKFDVACARAVARLNTLSEYCLPFVKTGGIFIAYKGEAREEIKEAANAIKLLGGEVEKAIEYELPQAGKRTLIIVRKIASTPCKYPRGQGKERKNPL